MNAAAMARRSKAERPQDYCPKCLWKQETRQGYKPCPKHAPIAAAWHDPAKCEKCERSGVASTASQPAVEKSRRDGTEGLVPAVAPARCAWCNREYDRENGFGTFCSRRCAYEELESVPT